MTAIEVLAATVLASLMLASVLGVMGALARQQKALRMLLGAPNWQQQLADQWLWDLQNSREFAVWRDRVRLVGFAGRDFATGHPTGRPTAVEYYLLDTEDDRWLVRREEHLDEHTNRSWRVEVVCRGATRIEFGSATVDQIATETSGLSLPPTGEMAAVPDRIAVKLYGAAGETPFFDKLLLVR